MNKQEFHVNKLQSNKKALVEDVNAILVSAYKAYYTLNDIKNMTVFYESAAVKQMIADKTKLTDTQRQQIVNFYNFICQLCTQ